MILKLVAFLWLTLFTFSASQVNGQVVLKPEQCQFRNGKSIGSGLFSFEEWSSSVRYYGCNGPLLNHETIWKTYFRNFDDQLT
jgi:hypothetical protein